MTKEERIIERIKMVVEESKKFPNPRIHYNIDELPKDENIKENMFYGVPAEYNTRVEKETMCQLIYKLS